MHRDDQQVAECAADLHCNASARHWCGPRPSYVCRSELFAQRDGTTGALVCARCCSPSCFKPSPTSFLAERNLFVVHESLLLRPLPGNDIAITQLLRDVGPPVLHCGRHWVVRDNLQAQRGGHGAGGEDDQDLACLRGCHMPKAAALLWPVRGLARIRRGRPAQAARRPWHQLARITSCCATAMPLYA